MRRRATPMRRLAAGAMTLLGYGLYTAVLVALGLVAIEAWYHFDEESYKRYRYLVYEPPMFDPSDTIPYKLAANFTDSHVRRGEFDVTIRTNAQGLREDRIIEIPKPKDVFRIITLGDSFAFDFGAEREKAFQAVAENILNGKVKGKRIEVVNMGYASAYSPDAALIFLRERGMDFEPDVVLHVLTHTNDFGNVSENLPFSEYDSAGLPIRVQYLPIVIDPVTGHRTNRYFWEIRDAEAHFLGTGPTTRQAKAAEPNRFWQVMKLLLKLDIDGVQRESRLYQVVSYFLLMQGNAEIQMHNARLIPAKPHRLGEESIEFPGLPEFEFGTHGVRQEGWNITKTVYLEMQRISVAHGAKFGVVLVPQAEIADFVPGQPNALRTRMFDASDLARGQKEHRAARVIGHFARQNGMGFLDLLPGMLQGKTEDYYFPFDAHWNHAGHKRVGEVMADWLLATGWLPPR